MRALAFIVICCFINGHSCGETIQLEKDSRIGVCPVVKEVNGIYKSVDKCCNGYKHIKNTDSPTIVCEPKCGPDDFCVYGNCTALDICTCYDGYELKKGNPFVCLEKCKNGYVRDPETDECTPHCDDGCVNGRCVQPNKCECNQGYTLPDLRKPNECQCEIYCAEINGTCECLHKDQRFNGLLIHNNTTSLCNETIFSEGNILRNCSCLNGFYTTNETCVCANGYKMREGFHDLCEPNCEIECVNGLCIEPNTCQCDNGYEGYESNYACTASALIAERQKAGMNWVIPGILLTLVVLATFLGGGFFIRKRKKNSSEVPARQNVSDAHSDRFNIEVYSLEDF